MPTTLSFDDLDNLIDGAAFLGSGGGGPLPLARKLLDYAREHELMPQLIEWSEIPSDARIATVAGIGSPCAAAAVNAPFTEAPQRIFKALEQALGHPLDGIVPGETGPMNSLIPMVVAAQLGKPVLNGDGAGRAMSTLAMSTFNEVAPVKPFLLGNETPDIQDQITANLTLTTPDQADSLTRSIVSQAAFGSSGAFASWPCRVGNLAEVAVQGSVRQAIEVGAILRSARLGGSNPVEALQDYFGSRLHCLYSGYLTQVDSHTSQGFDITRIRMTAPDQPGVTLYALNETMAAWRDDLDHPLGVGPDSLCYVTEQGDTFTNANLSDYLGKTDQRIHLLGLEALPVLLKPSILAAYRAVLVPMGYAGPYHPLSYWKDDHGCN